jgi:DNA topoisomerase-1
MVIKDGRFGPYVTDGETNASLRKGDDVVSITDDRASELLAERRARGPVVVATRDASRTLASLHRRGGALRAAISSRAAPAARARATTRVDRRARCRPRAGCPSA